MKVIDLTHSITNNMNVYPGGPKPQNRIVDTVKESGFKETEIHIRSHNGTHMDAPNHVFEDGISLDKICVSNFIGKAALIDCSNLSKNEIITYDFIENNIEIINKSEFLIFKTNWNRYWNKDEYTDGYPLLSDKVIDFIISSKKKGIGFDAISIDTIDSESLENHHKILGNNILIYENLTNLDLIDNNLFTFCALPLKFENSDGAPIRAIAIID